MAPGNNSDRMAGLTLEQAANIIAQQHNAGREMQAESTFRQVLNQLPKTAEVLLAFGTALQNGNQSDRAMEVYQQVIRLQPNHADALFRLGVAQANVSRLDLAIDAWQKVVQIRPDYGEAYINLAAAWGMQEKWEKALATSQQAVQLRPDNSHAHLNLGVALQKANQLEQSEFHCRRAIELQPNFADAYLNLGSTLTKLKRRDEAIAACQKAIQLQPASADSWYNLAIAWMSFDEIDQSIATTLRAIELKPDYVDAWSNLGVGYEKKGELEKAIAAWEKAVEINPHFADAHANLCMSLEKVGELKRAMAAGRRSIELNPGLMGAHWNLSLQLLKMGQFAEGWKEYEWRTHADTPFEIGRYPQPQWRGEDPSGKTILLHSEQGLGDTIQFSRYVPLLARRGAKVLLLGPTELHRLFVENFGHCAQVIRKIETDFDLHCPLPSLPGAFQTDLQNMPADVPYLHPPRESIEEWGKRFDASDRRPRVGLAWAGRPDHTNDKNRSIALWELAPLADSQISWHSLQKGPRSVDAASPLSGMKLTDHSEQLTDFADTAALIHHLDLVISVDTSVIHLAGAMGKPIWVLLPWCPDWRWLIERSDSPWYPTMRLFRQPHRSDWPGAIQSLAEALKHWLANPPKR